MNTYDKTRYVQHLLKYNFIWTTKENNIELNNKSKIIIKNTIDKLSLEHDFQIINLKINKNYINLIIQVLPKYSPSQLMNIIKGTTGRKILENCPELNITNSLWSRTYFVNTIGEKNKNIENSYIKKQLF